MKKAYLLFILLVIFLNSCDTTKNLILKIKPKNEEPAVSFTDKSKSIIFFGAKDSTTQNKKHREFKTVVNAFFGPITTNLPVFDIGKENLVEYANEEGQFYFYNPKSLRQFGMVISNGINSPIIVTNPKKYLSKIKSYLEINEKDINASKQEIADNKQKNTAAMEQILKTKFVANKDYSLQLINNANTNNYPFIAKFKEKNTCPCKVTSSMIFSDLACKKSLGDKTITTTNNQHQTIKLFTESGATIQETFYNRNEFGLIKNIIYKTNNTETSRVEFVYEADMYQTIRYEGGIADSFETFYLNEKKQCIRRTSQRQDKSYITDTNFSYDSLGRKVDEVQETTKLVYKYKDNSSDYFSEYCLYNNPNELISRNVRILDDQKLEYFTYNANDQIVSKSVTITTDNCTSKTISYNINNKIDYVYITNCEN